MPDIFISLIVLGAFYLIIYKCRKKKDKKIKKNENI